MRLTPLIRTHGTLLSCALALATGRAWAQTPAPAAPPAATPPAAAPATPAPAPAPAAPAEAPTPPPADSAAAPAAPAEEESYPAAWFRIDSDLNYLQLWAGATHSLSDSIGLATDLYVQDYFGTGGPISFGEFDIGPAITAGTVLITPMLGFQADFGNHRMAALVPQLYVVGGPDPIYFELWLQNYEYTVFDKSGTTAAGGGNSIYGRFFIDYKLGTHFAVGPEVEISYALNSKSWNTVSGDKLASLPVGVNVMLPNYGKGNTFLIFAGYETADTGNDAHLAGRLTFVRNF